MGCAGSSQAKADGNLTLSSLFLSPPLILFVCLAAEKPQGKKLIKNT
jgi:hypothetical protein